MPPAIFIIKNISPVIWETADIPNTASKRKITSPDANPPMRKSDSRNPSETAFATDAKTPGPGEADNTSIPAINAINIPVFINLIIALLFKTVF